MLWRHLPIHPQPAWKQLTYLVLLAAMSCSGGTCPFNDMTSSDTSISIQNAASYSGLEFIYEVQVWCPLPTSFWFTPCVVVSYVPAVRTSVLVCWWQEVVRGFQVCTFSCARSSDGGTIQFIENWWMLDAQKQWSRSHAPLFPFSLVALWICQISASTNATGTPSLSCPQTQMHSHTHRLQPTLATALKQLRGARLRCV
jgi:hypothetical protein